MSPKVLIVVLTLFAPLLALQCHNFAHNIVNSTEISTDRIITCPNVTEQMYCVKVKGYQHSNSFLWKGCSNDLATLDKVYGGPRCNGEARDHYKIDAGTVDVYCCDHDKCNFSSALTIPVFLIILSVFIVFWQ
uniref:Uncharacterized protein n=1 Tax=Panagrolaimus sp. JU765 TaxID=591449 RepID=A0AC34RE86_9BILA